MANDKLVDSGKLDAALTATANAIRTKTGDTAQISFDLSGQTGFKSAVEAITGGGGGAYDILATITGDTQTLAITDASGGLPEGIESIYYTTYIPATNQNDLSINHNLGTERPMLVAVFIADGTGKTFTAETIIMNMVVCIDGVYQRISGSGETAVGREMINAHAYVNGTYGENGMAVITTPTSTTYFPYAADENTFILKRSSSSKTFKAGETYNILVIKGADDDVL